ncbi:MAG: 3'-5' exonuclease [Lachnospiraceae bacterium]|nr:3'-5' exonuclease [Lachnospiraceae bacterium]
MALFAQCAQCGKKKLALTLDGDGICPSCQSANNQRRLQQEQEEREQAAKQREEDLSKAAAFYNELVQLWKRAGYDQSLNDKTIEDAYSAIADCDKFISLLHQIPEINCFQEIFAQHCSYLTGSECRSEDFGKMSTEKVGDDTIKIDFAQLETRSQRYRDKVEKAIEATNAFNDALAQIVHVDIVPDLTAVPKSASTILPVQTTNITAKTSLNKLSVFYVIDVETTGLNPIIDEIIQITALRFLNFEPVETFTTYVKPRNGLNPKAQKINGITEKDVENAPYIEQVIRLFDAFLSEPHAKKEPPIVGHKISFDYQFLTAHGSTALSVAMALNSRKFYDTLELSKREYSYRSVFTLEALTENILNVLRSDAHDSLSDALATGLLFKQICKNRIGF